MRKSSDKTLGRAVTEQMRVLADLAGRWLRNDDADCAGAWTRRGALVIVAVGSKAARIAGELERAGLLVAQHDKPEHLAPGGASDA